MISTNHNEQNWSVTWKTIVIITQGIFVITSVIPKMVNRIMLIDLTVCYDAKAYIHGTETNI